MIAASLFTRNCSDIEAQYPEVESRGEAAQVEAHELRMQTTAYAMSAVSSAVAFLESTINEFYARACQPELHFSLPFDAGTVEVIADVWASGLAKRSGLPVLDKFQLALTLARKTKFAVGQAPYQDVYLVISLRNALIHDVPDWQYHFSLDPKDTHKLERMLHGKFALSSVFSDHAVFMPSRCLGHGCARWAVVTCLDFVDEFNARMGIDRPLNRQGYATE